MNSEDSLQMVLFNKIIAGYDKKAEAVNELMDVLSVNKDGIYRRMRGDTALTADEVYELATHYQLSIDELLTQNSNKTYFYYNSFNRNINNFGEYLEQVHQHIYSFSRLPNNQLYYATREIPIFFYTSFPKLLAFKLYVYGISTWYFDYLIGRKFSFDLLSPHDLELAKSMSELYTTINSIDLWTLSILEQTLNQIISIAIEGRFQDENTALSICDEVRALVNHCKLMAEKGLKFMPGESPLPENGKFELFYNELASTNNTILAISDVWQGVFNTFDNPNFLHTNDPKLCQASKDWFYKVMSHSIPLSIYDAKNRDQFFNKLIARIDRTSKRLESFYDTY